MTDLSTLSKGSFLGAITLKSLTTASVFIVGNKYLNDYSWKDPILLRGFASSLISSDIAELLMTSIIQRLLSFDGNAGVKRIFDQGLNAALSGAINIKAYELLVKNAPNVEGAKWNNHEEFVAQFIADFVEVLSYHYLVPLLGFNKAILGTMHKHFFFLCY